jgi:hypothetical protein
MPNSMRLRSPRSITAKIIAGSAASPASGSELGSNAVPTGNKGRRMTDKHLLWVAAGIVLLDVPAGSRSRSISPGKPE